MCVCAFMSDSLRSHRLRQAPLSVEFCKQEYWNGLPFPTPADVPAQRSNLNLFRLLYWQTVSLPRHHLGGSSTNMAPNKYVLLIFFSQFLYLRKKILNFNKVLERVLSSSCISLRKRELKLLSLKLETATYLNPSNECVL